ncbi:murein biosynthesis integral membrane protein MurJ [Enterobacteriaceae endosymbiont of Neohaemonia nigricornis]|uniref:murein biosynthesis integral membrane protein MurJ n=1 Tax=Enterobacteriaceae endosymbiont of Neohaemonia nigricornis TaxID=2675792 RepID=UPI00144998B8|nr:murein biosynthesis integral membrane protein MurJ [Enterobacteriaceae endosymbiont of Neohaemonia nigricornis]QJC30538.1 murein biosynthesis integral membrane protein MurJ [Enterobacteriaceae endosymbiont of Neohaemonia nigricornis]
MNLLKSLTTVSIITLFSRLLGFIRDSLIARIFGAGIYSDSFFIAFKLPNLLRRIFAEGAFSQAFTPILAEYKNTRTEKDTKHFIASILGILLIILTTIVLLGIIFSSYIISIIAPGFVNTDYKLSLTSKILKITFPYILLISLSSLASSILNIWKNFFVPAITPILLNFSMIICILIFPVVLQPPILILAWSVLFGGFLQIAYQLIYLKQINMLVLPTLKMLSHGVIRVFKKMATAIIGVSATQISLLINSGLASFLVTGSITWIYYADRLMELPVGMFGIALTIVLLPSLTDAYTKNNEEEYNHLIDIGLRLCFLLIIPSSLILGFLSKSLLITLFQYGQFTYFDILMTQNNLMIYAFGLLFLIVSKVLALAFYARQNVITPVRVSIFVLIITQFISPIFIYFFKHIGFAIAICLAAFLNVIFLLYKLLKNKIYKPQPGWFYFLYRILIVTIVLSIVLIYFKSIISERWLILSTFITRITYMFSICMFVFIIYIITLFLLGFRMKQFSINNFIK